MNPTMRVVLLQHQTMLLSDSDKGYEVIGTGEPNQPAGVRSNNNYNVWDDDWQNP